MKKIFFVMLLGGASLLTSCGGGSKDVDKIGNAQFCLDSLAVGASSSEVDTCLSKVEGLSTSGAESIRCSGGFIREGFSDASRFVKAFSAISGGTSGSNTQTLMGILTFTSTNSLTTDATHARDTFNSCYASGSKGSTLLASFSYLTMSLVTYYNSKNAGTCPSTPGTDSNGYKYYNVSGCISGDIVSAIPLVDASTVDAAAISAQNGIGAVVIAAVNVSCTTGSSANNALCDLLKKAVTDAGGTSNPRVVAVKFFQSALGL